MRARSQDPLFTLPVEVRLRAVDLSARVEVGAKQAMSTAAGRADGRPRRAS